jgi:hypothetical protein
LTCACVSTKFNEGQAFYSVFTQFPPEGWRAAERGICFLT